MEIDCHLLKQMPPLNLKPGVDLLNLRQNLRNTFDGHLLTLRGAKRGVFTKTEKGRKFINNA